MYLKGIESKTTQTTSDTYERMATWVDKQISKLILGQTMTADDGASRSQAQVHDNVREDIANSDIRQIIETLNSSLTVPYVNFNFGGVVNYPSIELFKPDTKNIEQVIKAVEVLGDKGLTVKADELREMLGLSKPDKNDETVGGRLNADRDMNALNSKQTSDTVANPSIPQGHRRVERLHTPHPAGVSLNSQNIKDDDSIIDGYNLDDDYIAIEDDIADTLKKAIPFRYTDVWIAQTILKLYGPVKSKHRDEHASWDGLILPKHDAWWNSHTPPNGYGCKCYTVAITKERKERYETKGIPTAIPKGTSYGRIDGESILIKPITTAPKTTYKTYYNERKGIVEKVPNGVHPTFNFNPAVARRLPPCGTRDLPIFDAFMRRLSAKRKGKASFPTRYEKIHVCAPLWGKRVF